MSNRGASIVASAHAWTFADFDAHVKGRHAVDTVVERTLGRV